MYVVYWISNQLPVTRIHYAFSCISCSIWILFYKLYDIIGRSYETLNFLSKLSGIIQYVGEGIIETWHGMWKGYHQFESTWPAHCGEISWWKFPTFKLSVSLSHTHTYTHNVKIYTIYTYACACIGAQTQICVYICM